MQGTCLTCHRLGVPEIEGALFVHQISLLERNHVLGSMKLESFVNQYEAQIKGDESVFKDDLLTKLDNLAKELLAGKLKINSILLTLYIFVKF